MLLGRCDDQIAGKVCAISFIVLMGHYSIFNVQVLFFFLLDSLSYCRSRLLSYSALRSSILRGPFLRLLVMGKAEWNEELNMKSGTTCLC